MREASRRSSREVVTAQFGEWDDEFHRRLFEEQWSRSGFEVIELSRRPIGALWLVDEGTHLQLEEIFLLPEFTGRGLGTRILGELLEEARAEDKPLRLRVLRLNRARRLYERLGFTTYHETDTHFWMQRS